MLLFVLSPHFIPLSLTQTQINFCFPFLVSYTSPTHNHKLTVTTGGLSLLFDALDDNPEELRGDRRRVVLNPAPIK